MRKTSGIYKKGNSPYWYFNFKLPGKPRVIQSTHITDKNLAQKICDTERGKAQSIIYNFEVKRIKLKTLMDKYLEIYTKHNKQTYVDDKGKFNKLKSFLGELLANELNPSKLEEYRLHRLKEGVSKATVNREMALLKHVYTQGIEWGDCQLNPVKKIKFYSEKENRRMRYLEHQEKVNLLNACTESVRQLVFFALQTGCRQGEILNLKWKNVDFNTNLIEIVHSKAKKPRYIPISNELRNMLKSLAMISEYVFGTAKGKAGWTLYRKTFEKAVEDAHIMDFRFHDLRHCFASDLVMKGVDLKTVAELLGHASTQMTERYSHLSPNHKRIAIEMLPKGLMCSTNAPLGFDKISEKKESYSKISLRRP